MVVIIGVFIMVICIFILVCSTIVFCCSEYARYGYGFGSSVKGYINKTIKHSCVDCKYQDAEFCHNPKVLELEARDYDQNTYNSRLRTSQARKYSIFCYKREKMKINSQE